MLFASRTANLVMYFSCATLVLWLGPAALLPGYSASLPVATTEQGRARGEVWSSRAGRSFSVWRGLRYARPPLGDRRFRRPEALGEEEAWQGERDFTSELPLCYQLSMVGGFHSGQEDCLFLNVYSPVVEEEERLLPVMVFIHGGGFVVGDATSWLGPHYLMDEEVVVVALHYRLGILGFLSSGGEEAPGNLGLWDQRQALVWVRDNIGGFGGDPDRVTIFGESAGAMAVNYHLLSPQSRGLFHSAILQSGTAISPYTRLARPPANYTSSLASALDCQGDALDCLRALPARKLYLHLFLFDSCSVRRDLGLTFPGPWVPWVDSELQDPFLPSDPESILRDGQDHSVPVMIGFTSEEGLLYTGRFQKDPAFHTHFLENWSTCGPINLLGKEEDEISQEDVDKLDALRGTYPAGTPGLTDMFTDAIFAASSHQVSRLLVANNRTVYKYLFTYRGSTSLADLGFSGLLTTLSTIFRGLLRMSWGPSLGAAHGEELLYLFQITPFLDLLPAPSDRALSVSLVSWWTSFARTGRPAEAWLPAARGREQDYWVVDGPEGGMQERRELARLDNWL